jgi:hypothetical protein
VIVVVFGSRHGVSPRRVEQWIEKLSEKHPSAIVMSGGAKGVDQVAERAAAHYGLRVASLRPEQWVRWQPRQQPLAPERRVDEDDPTESELVESERFRQQQRELQTLVADGIAKWVVAVYEHNPGGPTKSYAMSKLYDSFRDAALARDTMMAELADQGAAFWDGASSGTAFTMSEFTRLGKEDKLTVLT